MNGYTLIEILVVVIILLIISTLVLAYNRSTELNVLVLTEQLKIKAFLNQAKNFALERKNFDLVNKTICGFGVNFSNFLNSKKIIVFADLKNDCSFFDGVYNENEDFKISEYVLKTNLDLRDESNASISNLNFLFVGPYLKVYKDGILLNNDYKFYLVNLKNLNKKALIKIGPEGNLSTID